MRSTIKYLPAFYFLFNSCQPGESGSAKPSTAQIQIKSVTESDHDPEENDRNLAHEPEISANSFITKSEFNQKGNLLKKEQYNDRGKLEWREVYTYDEVGQLLEMVSYHFKKVSIRRICKYGKENPLVECNDFEGGGKNTKRQIVKKETNGHTIVWDYVLTQSMLIKTSEGIFDQNESNIKNSYFSDGRLLATEENQYDMFGNRVESMRSDVLNGSQRITHFKVDRKNNAIETLILDGNLFIESRIVTRYNDQHHLVEQLTYGIKGNLKESVLHLYEYDGFGQWIKDITVINKKPISVRVRKLEYF